MSYSLKGAQVPTSFVMISRWIIHFIFVCISSFILDHQFIYLTPLYKGFFSFQIVVSLFSQTIFFFSFANFDYFSFSSGSVLLCLSVYTFGFHKFLGYSCFRVTLHHIFLLILPISSRYHFFPLVYYCRLLLFLLEMAKIWDEYEIIVEIPNDDDDINNVSSCIGIVNP